jgi:Tol biopolymer transport system component
MAEPEPVRGTEGAQLFLASPDGRWLAFVAPVAERSTQQRLLKVPLDGSAPPVPVCNWDNSWGGSAAWLDSGDLLTSADDGRKWVRISMQRGASGAPRAFDVPGLDARCELGTVLPGDRSVFLNTTYYDHGAFHLGIGVLDLKSGKSRILIPEGSNAVLSPTGHLLFTRGDALLAAAFDPGNLEVRGEPAAILDGLRIGAGWQNATIDFASNGTLVYRPGGNVAGDRRLVVLGPGGEASDWSGERQSYESSLDVSRDGGRAATVIANAGGIYEIWLSERGNATSRRIVAREGADCSVPVWSPDGRRIAYTLIGTGVSNGVYVAAADGSGAPVLVAAPPDSTVRVVPSSWTPDGSQLLLTLQRAGKPSMGVVSASPAAGTGPAAIRPLFADDAIRALGLISPDGRTLAYLTGESGKVQINLVAWGPSGPEGTPVPVSANTTNTMFWSSDGRRLHYVDPQQKLMAVAVTREPQLAASRPVEVFALDRLSVAFGLIKPLPGGSFLAVHRGANEGDIDRLDVVLHFDREIREKFAKARR